MFYVASRCLGRYYLDVTCRETDAAIVPHLKSLRVTEMADAELLDGWMTESYQLQRRLFTQLR